MFLLVEVGYSAVVNVGKDNLNPAGGLNADKARLMSGLFLEVFINCGLLRE